MQNKKEKNKVFIKLKKLNKYANTQVDWVNIRYLYKLVVNLK
jgi:hypothetical protein